MRVSEIPENVELPKDLVRHITETFKFFVFYGRRRREFFEQQEHKIFD